MLLFQNFWKVDSSLPNVIITAAIEITSAINIIPAQQGLEIGSRREEKQPAVLKYLNLPVFQWLALSAGRSP